MRPRDVIKPVAIASVGIVAEAGLILTATTVENHRHEAHKSLVPNGAVRAVLKAAIYPFNDPKSWAAVHRGPHHNVTDADLSNFMAIADYSDWREANPEAATDNPELPEYFDNLDPGARRIPLQTVREIGACSRSLVEQIYEPPDYYGSEQAAQLLDDSAPRYYYENIHDKDPRKQKIPAGEKRTLGDVRYRLRDTHAGVLHEEGLKGVFRDNPALYVNADQQYNRDGLPEDLRRGPLEEKLSKLRGKMLAATIVGHILLPATVSLARNRKIGQAIKQGVVGGSIIGGTAIALLKGAGLVNSLGHGGRHPIDAWKTGKITPHEDGDYATNAKTLIGSIVTLDEASRQGDHHDHPEWIAFGNKWIQAPYGKTLEWLADHGIGMKRGPGFPDQDVRPDLPHPAVMMLRQERIRTMREENGLPTAA